MGITKIKGPYYEQLRMTFPHKAVKAHGDHIVAFKPGERIFVVRCDGTVIGAQG